MPRHRRRNQAVVAVAALVVIWAGVAFWPSTSASITVAVYQAGGPDIIVVQRLGGEPGPRYPHPELRGDGDIAGPVSVGRSFVVVRGGSVWALGNARSPARAVAPGCGVLPSSGAGRIWVESCDAPVTLQAFDLAGQARSAVLHLPSDYGSPLSATSDGLMLLAGRALPHPAVIIWDSRTGRVVGGTDQRVISVAPDLAVTEDGPAPGTYLFDVRSQQLQSASVPPATAILAGVLSPDGRMIAVVVGHGTDSGLSQTELGVIDVHRRILRVVPNSVTGDGYWQLGWSRTGDRLVAGDGQPRPGLIARISVFDLAHTNVQRWSLTGGPFTGFVIS